MNTPVSASAPAATGEAIGTPEDLSLAAQFQRVQSHVRSLPRALMALVRQFKAEQGFLVLRDGQRRRLLVNSIVGVHRDSPSRFELDCAFSEGGPWAEPTLCTDTACWRPLVGSNSGDGMVMALSNEAAIGLFRNDHAMPFVDEDRQSLAALLPIIAGALPSLRRAAEQELASDTAAGLLDMVTSPLLVAEANGFVVFANMAASALLSARDGIALDDGFLFSPALRANGRLLALLSSTARSVLTSAPTGGALSLPRGNDRRPLGVLVQPFPHRSGALTGEKPLVALQLSALDVVQAPQVEVLRGLFSLTPAEAGLLQALMQDRRIEDYAAERGVSVTTVRTQLAHLFRKTSTNRQSELVRLALVAAGCLKLH